VRLDEHAVVEPGDRRLIRAKINAPASWMKIRRLPSISWTIQNSAITSPRTLLIIMLDGCRAGCWH